MTAPICAATKDRHPAAHEDGSPTGHLLCAEHYETLRKTLREIEDEARELDTAPSIAMQWNTSGGSSKGSTLASQQVPIRLDPAVLNDHRVRDGLSEEDDDRIASGGTMSVLGTLHYWAGRTREEHQLVVPKVVVPERVPGVHDMYGPTCPALCLHESCPRITWYRTYPEPPTIHRERELLTKQLPWVVEQEWVGEFYRKMRKLLNQLQRANGTLPPKPFGRCPAQPEPGEKCGGPLWYATPTYSTGEWSGSTPSCVACGECGTRWEGGRELALLFMTLEKDKAAKMEARNGA